MGRMKDKQNFLLDARNRAIMRVFKHVRHPHIVKLISIAMPNDIEVHGGWLATAFKWQCVICGREIIEATGDGLNLLENGELRKDVFIWHE